MWKVQAEMLRGMGGALGRTFNIKISRHYSRDVVGQDPN